METTRKLGFLSSSRLALVDILGYGVGLPISCVLLAVLFRRDGRRLEQTRGDERIAQ